MSGLVPLPGGGNGGGYTAAFARAEPEMASETCRRGAGAAAKPWIAFV